VAKLSAFQQYQSKKEIMLPPSISASDNILNRNYAIGKAIA